MLSKIALSLIVFFVISCGSFLNKTDYSEAFLKKIKTVRTLHSDGKIDDAFISVNKIIDKDLSVSEVAMKYNMRGFLYFSVSKFREAIIDFKKALNASSPDQNLNAQINLNLASSYFKISDNRTAFVYVTNIDHTRLSENDFKIFSKLYLVLSRDIGEAYDITRAIIFNQRDLTSISQVRDGQFSSLMLEKYFSMTKTRRMVLLEEFEGKNNLNIAYIGLQEAKKLYFEGDKTSAKDVLSWIKNQFSSNPDLVNRIDNFVGRMQNVAKMVASNIGVVLPLTGKKSFYGEKALRGLDTAMAKATGESQFKLFVKDSKNSKVVATMATRELITKNFVSVIVGGLFPSTAIEEYLEARKYGVLFISLSQIYLPKDQKNHLLIEIPGSIESQVSSLFSESFLTNMGRKIAMLYPNTTGGLAYLDEVWRTAEIKSVQLTSVHHFDDNLKDFREPVEKLLGLHFKRERQEEHELWADAYSEQKSSIRRVQVLKPVLDFDWVFIPAFPKQADQIIPTFSYLDAKKVKFVGGPSWRSKKIQKQSHNVSSLMFIGDDGVTRTGDFSRSYVERYNLRPGFLESMAFDAAGLVFKMINQEFSSREELERSISQKAKLEGEFGHWNLVDGIWVKEMSALRFSAGKVVKAQMESI